MRGFFFAHIVSRMDPLLPWVLRGPLHRLVSDRLMLLRYKGRRSGRDIALVVGYAEKGSDVLVLLANTPDRTWWRNFRTTWPASLRIRGRDRSVEGHLVEPGGPEYRECFELMFRRFPEITGIYDTRFDPERGLTDTQVSKLAERRGAVRFEPRNGRPPPDDSS